ncbi:MAG: phage holin family protein [Vallitaleaceae bacterium]|nr:phage holin family protein [Vallitaleaceae bacterium]
MWNRPATLSVRLSLPKLRFFYFAMPIFLLKDVVECLYEIIAFGIWMFPKAEVSLRARARLAYRRIALKILVNIVVAYGAIRYLSMGHMDSELSLVWFSFVLLFMNMLIRPLLLILSLPISLISFGLFSFFVNAWVVQWTDAFIKGLRINGFISAFLIALVTFLLSNALNKFTIEK